MRNQIRFPVSHCTEAIFMCIKDYLYDLGEGMNFLSKISKPKTIKKQLTLVKVKQQQQQQNIS